METSAAIASPEYTSEYFWFVDKGILTNSKTCRITVGVLQQAQTQNGEQASVLRPSWCSVKKAFDEANLPGDWLYAAASVQGAQLNIMTRIQINQLAIFTFNTLGKTKKKTWTTHRQLFISQVVTAFLPFSPQNGSQHGSHPKNVQITS